MTDGGYGRGRAAPSGGDPFGGDPFVGDPFAVGGPGASASQTPAPTSQQQETNTLATLSVVFAFVFAPAGVILGHLALSQIHETGDRGRDRALVGVTLSYVFITVAVVALVVAAAGVHAR
jgi:eukaryotic-like serine/threonine-protein kinase